MILTVGEHSEAFMKYTWQSSIYPAPYIDGETRVSVEL